MPQTNPSVEETTQTNPNPVDDAINDLDQVTDSEVQEDEQAQAQQTQEGQTPAEDGHDESPTKQSRRTNAEYAQRRRNAEAAIKAEQERLQHKAYTEGKIAGIGGVNPYTHEPIEDEADLHDYELMKKLDDEGKNPLEEFPKLVRQERLAQKAQAAKAEEETKRQEEAHRQSVEAVKSGIQDLAKKYPEVTLDRFRELYNGDPTFKSYVLHGYSPTEAYEMCHYHEKKPEQKPEPRDSTPSSIPSGTGNSRKPIGSMSLEEYEEYAKEVHGEEYR